MRISKLLCLALATPLLISGCEKFGNKSVTELNGYDTLSGYYTSMPQKISFAAKIGATPDRTRSGTVNQMPDFLKIVMGNPTALNFYAPGEGLGAVMSRTEKSMGIPTNINPKASTYGASSTATANIGDCTLIQEIVHDGTFNQIPSEVAGLKTRGQLTLNYSIRYSLNGADAACDSVRTRFKTCYIDGTGCAADANSIFYPAFVYEMFDPFVNSSTITDTEIGSFREISYQARYE